MEQRTTDIMIAFFKAGNFEDALANLKTSLKRETQIEYYDMVYNNFILGLHILDPTLRSRHDLRNKTFDQRTIIPGLSNVIITLIYAAIYRKELFDKEQNSQSIKNYLMGLLESDDLLFDRISPVLLKKYFSIVLMSFDFKFNTIDKGIFRIAQDSSIRKRLDASTQEEKDFYTYNIQNTNVVFFEYILIGNRASISNLVDFTDGFFNDTLICKLFISAHLNESVRSAHNNVLNNCHKFLTHDYDHITACIDSLSKPDFETVKSNYKVLSQNRNSFVHRFYSFVCFTKYFEYRKDLNELDIYNINVDHLNDYQMLDMKWILNFILQSKDVSYDQIPEMVPNDLFQVYSDDYMLEIYDVTSHMFDKVEYDKFFYKSKEILTAMNLRFKREIEFTV